MICAITRLNSGVGERKYYSEKDHDDFGLSILFDSDDEWDESYIPSQDEGSDSGRGIDVAGVDAAGLEKDTSGEGVVDSLVSEEVEAWKRMF